MSNPITEQLHAGWLEKLEADRVDAVKERARMFAFHYNAAKKVFKGFTAEYQTNGWVRVYVSRVFLSGMAGLKTFKQTGWDYYEHYSKNIGIYLPSVIGDEAYLKMNLPALVAGRVT